MDTSTIDKTKYTYADGKSVPYTLKKSMRADCCGISRALFEVKFHFGTLYFCNHHFNIHKDALMDESISILDESNVLKSK